MLLTQSLLIVLERTPPFRRVFTNDGAFRQATGNRGSGPGEFQRALSAAYDSSRKLLLVLDPANRRLSTFTVSDTLRLLRAHRLDVPNPAGVCFVNGRTFVSSLGAHLIIELAFEQERAHVHRSLGEPRVLHALARHPMVRSRAAQGPLFCDTRTETAFIASTTLGEVNAVHLPSGRQQTYRLPGFVTALLEPVDGGLQISVPPDQQYDEVVGVLATPDGAAAVVGRHTPEHHGAYDYAAYRLIPLAGAPVSAAVASPWRPMLWSTDGVVCYTAEPAPTLAAYAGRSCPGPAR